MRSRVFNTAAAVVMALLAITVNSTAQRPATAKASPKTVARASAKTCTAAKATVCTNAKATVKANICTGTNVAVKTLKLDRVKVTPSLRMVKIEPEIILPPAAPTAMLTTVEAERLSDLDALHTQQRLNIRQGIRIRARDEHKRIDPDSPANAAVADMPAVAYGFRDFDPDDEQTPAPDMQESKITIQLKDYSKTYDVDANDKLVINNSFGDVTVHTWNRNEFKVDVHIKVTANEGDVLISDTRVNSMVSFTTKISQNGRSLFASKRTINNIIVNYTIYMPAKNALEISNSFGTINLPDMAGRVVINSEHGALIAKNLASTGNMINVSNGSANIESLKESDLNAENGTLVLVSAEKLNANISNSTAKIGRIIYAGNINAKYGGGLLIGDVSKNIQNLTINSKYTNVKLGVNNSQNANFDVTIRYGNFTYDKNANIYVLQKDTNDNRDKWSATQNYKGYVGKGSTSKLIFINSSYSTVSLTD